MLVRDVDFWERLFTNPEGGDNWGFARSRRCCQGVQEPIAIDGRSEMRRAQPFGLSISARHWRRRCRRPEHAQGLVPRLYGRVVRTESRWDKKEDFLARNEDGPGGKGDFQGCSEFNALLLFSQDEASAFESAADKTERNQENAPNRRVMTSSRPRTAGEAR